MEQMERPIIFSVDSRGLAGIDTMPKQTLPCLPPTPRETFQFLDQRGWRPVFIFMLSKSGFSIVVLSSAVVLSSCQFPQLPQLPFPPGVVRAPDGTLYLDPHHVPQGQRPASPVPDMISHWDGGPGNGPPRVRLVLCEQTAYFFRGDVLVGKSWLSTGNETHPTPTGRFSVLQKDKNHKSSRYGAFVDAEGNVVDGDVDIKKDPVPKGLHYEGANMKNFMRLTSEGVGMHAGFLPGYPASHGCIRMPEHMSEVFFNNVTERTPVTIVP